MVFLLRFHLIFNLLVWATIPAFSQGGNDQEATYTKTITQRAERIVSGLHLTDSTTACQVRDIITRQYRNLNDIHTQKESRIKAAQSIKETDKAAFDELVKNADNEANASLYKLHYDYLSKLMLYLNDEQIEKVKDGMTYGILPLTYKGYCEMIPTLTVTQKVQIMAWLVEAREHAMDAGSAEEKHGWFGKYKGRINNYLSAAGYDMKKESEAWQKRVNEGKKK